MVDNTTQAVGPDLAMAITATEDLITRLLEMARDRTGMTAAWLSGLHEGQHANEALTGAFGQFGLAHGASSALEASFCGRVIDGSLPGLVPDCGADPATAALAERGNLRIGSYVAMPIPAAEAGGDVVRGILCCLSRASNGSLGPADLQFMHLVARAIGDLTNNERAVEALQRRIRDRVGRVIRHGRLTTVLQPIVSLASGLVVGAEALARFAAEPVRPDLWFADAESVGLGTALELSAIRSALAHLEDLPLDVYLSINASPRLICSGELHVALIEVPAARIVVELTEHEAVDDYDELVDAVERLRATGIRLAIDDVGAGFSSFAHVLRLQPDIMKIDISITRGIDQDPARRGLAKGIVSFARDIGATIVAEGVETQGELDTLSDIDVDAAQGFYLARPMPLPLPTSLPQPTPHLVGEAHRLTDGGDALGFIAKTWFNTNDLETVTRPLLEAILDRTGLQTSYLTVIDQETGALEHRYVRNRGELVLPEGTVVPWDDTLCKRCRDARIRWTADVPADLPGSPAAEALKVQTFLSIPVQRSDGTVVGTLCAASTDPRYIGSSTLDEIELMARLLSDRFDDPSA